METNGRISVDEAAAALATTKRTRARVAWSGYPVWYWLTMGASLGAVCYAVLRPGWWALPIAAVAAATLIWVARAASRTRGVREGCQRPATLRDQMILGGPAAVLIIAGAVASKFASWPPAVAAVLVFLVYAGTGLTLSARAARP